ncbi:MAG: hypothetical protein AAB467_03105 [Patescibacteria group bacterium]
MNKKLIAAGLFVAAGLATYFLLPTKQPESQITPGQSPVTAEAKGTVVYSESGFLPASLTVKKGETVTWKNESSRSMWTASAMHPAHRGYSGTALEEHCPDTAGTAFDACKGFLPGETWSFTFQKIGTWPYHDHLNGGFYGKVIVE